MTNPEESLKDSPPGFTIESSPDAPGDEHPTRDWAGIRKAYEGEPDTQVKEICRRFGITQSALRYRMDQEHWPLRRVRRPKSRRIIQPTRKKLVGRLMRLLDRHVTRLEEDNVTPTDKEATLLGNASRTMSKLVELGAQRDKPGKTRMNSASREMAELRKKIAERIDQLNQA